MNVIIESLKQAIKDGEENGHRTILFPIPDAKRLVQSWNNFPRRCIYRDREWVILSVDMLGGELSIQNPKDGQLDNVDIEDCELL